MSAIKQFTEDYKNLKSFSDISEAELDIIILDILHNFPNCGCKSMRGHLLCKGHKVQEESIREAMRRVDPEGNAFVAHYMQVDRGSFIESLVGHFQKCSTPPPPPPK